MLTMNEFNITCVYEDIGAIYSVVMMIDGFTRISYEGHVLVNPMSSLGQWKI